MNIDKVKGKIKVFCKINYWHSANFTHVSEDNTGHPFSPPCSEKRSGECSWLTTTIPYNTTKILFLSQLSYSFSASAVLLDKMESLLCLTIILEGLMHYQLTSIWNSLKAKNKSIFEEALSLKVRDLNHGGQEWRNTQTS